MKSPFRMFAPLQELQTHSPVEVVRAGVSRGRSCLMMSVLSASVGGVRWDGEKIGQMHGGRRGQILFCLIETTVN